MEKTDIYLLMVQKLLNSKQKTLKLMQFRYVQETFQNNFLKIISKKLDFMDMLVILVLIMMLLRLMIY